jgi:hypothetical protein
MSQDWQKSRYGGLDIESKLVEKLSSNQIIKRFSVPYRNKYGRNQSSSTGLFANSGTSFGKE